MYSDLLNPFPTCGLMLLMLKVSFSPAWSPLWLAAGACNQQLSLVVQDRCRKTGIQLQDLRYCLTLSPYTHHRLQVCKYAPSFIT